MEDLKAKLQEIKADVVTTKQHDFFTEMPYENFEWLIGYAEESLKIESELRDKVGNQLRKIELLEMELKSDKEAISKMAKRLKMFEEIYAITDTTLLERVKIPRPIEEWGEDYSDCLWWSFPIVEPPYCGTPLDADFPEYVTHFTRLIVPIK